MNNITIPKGVFVDIGISSLEAKISRVTKTKVYTITISATSLPKLLIKVHNACNMSVEDFVFIYNALKEA